MSSPILSTHLYRLPVYSRLLQQNFLSYLFIQFSIYPTIFTMNGLSLCYYSTSIISLVVRRMDGKNNESMYNKCGHPHQPLWVHCRTKASPTYSTHLYWLAVYSNKTFNLISPSNSLSALPSFTIPGLSFCNSNSTCIIFRP